MKKHFAPYNIALKLKELGFKDNCFGYFTVNGNNHIIKFGINANYDKYPKMTVSPIWQQVREFLKENYNIDFVVSPLIKDKDGDADGYFCVIYKDNKEYGDWQKKYDIILDKSYQEIDGDYVNQELYNKYVFEDKFAYKTYTEALESGINEILTIL